MNGNMLISFILASFWIAVIVFGINYVYEREYPRWRIRLTRLGLVGFATGLITSLFGMAAVQWGFMAWTGHPPTMIVLGIFARHWCLTDNDPKPRKKPEPSKQPEPDKSAWHINPAPTPV